jgi:hypothetical protein
VILHPGLSVVDRELPLFYLSHDISLSEALKKVLPYSRLSRRLNSISITVVNTYSVKAIFPVATRLIRRSVLVPPDFDLDG